MGRRRGAGELPAALWEVRDAFERNVLADGEQAEAKLQSGVDYGATAYGGKIVAGVVWGVEVDAAGAASAGNAEGIARMAAGLWLRIADDEVMKQRRSEVMIGSDECRG